MPINIYKFIYYINDYEDKEINISNFINSVMIILIIITIIISILIIVLTIILIHIVISMIHNLIMLNSLKKEVSHQEKPKDLPTTNPDLHNSKGKLINKGNHKYSINIMPNKKRISRRTIKLIKQQNDQIITKEIKTKIRIKCSCYLIEEGNSEKAINTDYLCYLAYLDVDEICTFGLFRMSAIRFIARMNNYMKNTCR